ncbi:MAG: hypothetical protein AAF620_00105 [Bacteroidota bacterium]
MANNDVDQMAGGEVSQVTFKENDRLALQVTNSGQVIGTLSGYDIKIDFNQALIKNRKQVQNLAGQLAGAFEEMILDQMIGYANAKSIEEDQNGPREQDKPG